MKTILFTILITGLLTIPVYAQVSINSSQEPPDISAMLDVKSTNKGFLPPRLTFTEMNSIINPAAGLMVFCTTTGQYYFNRGNQGSPEWAVSFYLPFAGTFNSALTLMDITQTGTSGIGSFILEDTTNINPVLLVQTRGTGNAGSFHLLNINNESAAISAEAISGNAVVAYNSSSTNSSVWAQNDGTTTAIVAQAASGNALYAENSGPESYCIWAENKSSGPVLGLRGTTGMGLYLENLSDSNSTLFATNLGNYTTIATRAAGGNALFAENSSSDYYSIWAQNNANGPTMGLSAIGGNTLFAQNMSDSNCTILAKNTGNWTTLATTATIGNAMFAGNSSNLYSTIYAKNNAENASSAIYAENSGLNPAIFGNNLKNSGDRSAGYFSAGSDYAWVGCNFSGISYKIIGTGSVSTIVETPAKESVSMFCPESPEILLTDCGVGNLVSGQCQITLDPVFSNNIIVNEIYPLKVFIQMEGDCLGVYVTNKTATGFEVFEFQGGKSSIPFSWCLMANRKDATDRNGNIISRNVGVRFPHAPAPLEKQQNRTLRSAF